MRLLAFAIVGLAATSTAPLAQPARNANWPPPTGSRIRLESPTLPERQTGTIISAGEDSVLFQSSKLGMRVAVRTSDVSRMEVVRGTHRSIAKGALIGFLIAGGGTAAITAATWKREPSFDFGRGGTAAFYGVGVGLIGGVAGAIIGSRPRESWEPVAIPKR